LADNERFLSITIDASQIAARKLGIILDYTVADGTISTNAELRESHSSLDTNVHIHGKSIPLEAMNKFFALPEGWLRGQLETCDVDLVGLVNSPVTWKGSVAAEISNFRQEQTA